MSSWTRVELKMSPVAGEAPSPTLSSVRLHLVVKVAPAVMSPRRLRNFFGVCRGSSGTNEGAGQESAKNSLCRRCRGLELEEGCGEGDNESLSHGGTVMPRVMARSMSWPRFRNVVVLYAGNRWLGGFLDTVELCYQSRFVTSPSRSLEQKPGRVPSWHAASGRGEG